MSARVKDALQLADTLERLWADPRFEHHDAREVRKFLSAWFITRYSIADHDEAFQSALRRTGLDRQLGWWRLVRRDTPRYRDLDLLSRQGCPTPKTRGPNAGQPCGKWVGVSFRVTDSATGEWKRMGWCRAHKAEGDLMRRRERALTNAPEPLPNSGGLLPSYIEATNWPDLYRWADSSWEPPFVGIIADDWPVLAKTATAPLVKVALSSVEGGRETAPATSAPVLTLVKS